MKSFAQYWNGKRRELALLLSLLLMFSNIPMVAMGKPQTARAGTFDLLVRDGFQGLGGTDVSLRVTVYHYLEDATGSNIPEESATASDASGSDLRARAAAGRAGKVPRAAGISSASELRGSEDEAYLDNMLEEIKENVREKIYVLEEEGLMEEAAVPETSAPGEYPELGEPVYQVELQGRTDEDGVVNWNQLSEYMSDGYILLLDASLRHEGYIYQTANRYIMDGEAHTAAEPVQMEKAPTIEEGRDYEIHLAPDLRYNRTIQYPITVTLLDEDLEISYKNTATGEISEQPIGTIIGELPLEITLRRKSADVSQTLRLTGRVEKAVHKGFRFTKGNGTVDLKSPEDGKELTHSNPATANDIDGARIRYSIREDNQPEDQPTGAEIDPDTGTVHIRRSGEYVVSAVIEENEFYQKSERIEYTIRLSQAYSGNLYREGTPVRKVVYEEGGSIPWPEYAFPLLGGVVPEHKIVNPSRDGKPLPGGDATIVRLANDRILLMGAGKLTIRSRLNNAYIDGKLYRDISGDIEIEVLRAEQSEFRFYDDPRYEKGSDPEVRRYTIPYGSEDWSSRHQYQLRAGGHKVRSAVPSYKITEGEDIASLAKNGILEFADKKTGKIRVSADVEGDYRYEPGHTEAEIQVVMPKEEFVNGTVSGKCAVIGDMNENGWYNRDVLIQAARGYRLSKDYSFAPGSQWKERFLISEGNPEGIQKLYLRDNHSGVITELDKLPTWKVDTTRPENVKISYQKPIKEILKEGMSFGIYKAKLEVTMRAEDAGSGIWRFGYQYVPEGEASSSQYESGTWNRISEGDSGFHHADPKSEKYSASFTIDPQYRGKIVFYAEDKAGNRTAGEEMGQILVIDDENPKASLSLDMSDADISSEGVYFQHEKQAELVLDEPNFFPEDDGLQISYEKQAPGESSYQTILPELHWQGKGRIHSALIPFLEEGHYRFSYRYQDPSGNEAEYSTPSELAFTIDRTNPEIRLNYDREKVNKTYFNAPIQVFLSILEENFSKSDDRTGVSYRFTAPGSKDTEEIILPNRDFGSENPHEKRFLLERDGSYALSVRVKDLSGRTAEVNDSFVIDRTPPEVEVALSNEGISNGRYFRSDREGTITVKDYHLDIASLKAFVSAKDKDGRDVPTMDYTGYLNNPANWQKISENEYRIPIRFSTDANYQFGLEVYDYAGNKNQSIQYGKTLAATEFTIDHQAPTGNIRIGSWDRSKDGTQWDRLLEFFHFGRWSQNREMLRIHAEDRLSGIYRAEYFRSQRAMKLEDLRSYSGYQDISTQLRDGDWSQEISPDDAFITYVHLQDYAGNDCYFSSDGVILDHSSPQIGTFSASGKRSNGLYSGDVSVALDVTDPLVNDASSGLRSVEYHVYNMGEQTQSGSLFSFSKEDPALGELVRSYSRHDAVIIDSKRNNSNSVAIRVTATDNAGNRVEREEKLSIDRTAPLISISYDNNDVRNGHYFRQNRVATITIQERNFKAEDVVLKLTSSNGRLPQLSEWSRHVGSGNGDDTIWTATLPFTEDGDYSLDLSYTDLAGNAAGEIQYAAGTLSPKEFTIDKTSPVMTVSYDNNEVQNQRYYRAARTASIQIEEHNFSETLVVPSITVATGSNLGLSSWNSHGDIHTASVGFSGDGRYALSVAAEDLAGNPAVSYQSEEFVIDTTPPEIRISGVEDQSANRGELMPVVEYSDMNLDPSAVRIELNGSRRGAVPAEGESAGDSSSGRFVFHDFPYEKESDDIYTLSAQLKDQAGNAAEAELQFSVNRFGSTYLLSEETRELNGRYVKEPVDIRVREINVDPLTLSKVTLFRNEEADVLQEGMDYQSVQPADGGSWYVRDYMIPRNHFVSDGLYGVNVHSEDRAGNISDNTQEMKDADIHFGIDKTSPELFVLNVEDGGTYTADLVEAVLRADDNLKLEQLTVYMDGQTAADWDSRNIKKTIAQSGDFMIPVHGTSDRPHILKAVAVDAAGNQKSIQVSDFVVTTNPLIRLFRSRAFKGASACVAVVGIFTVAWTTYGNRKKTKRR